MNSICPYILCPAKDWLWSSHRERIGATLPVLLDEIPIELPNSWDKYVDEPLTEKEIESLRRSVNRQSPFGDFEWQRRVSKKFGLESTLRQRGRPRKGAEK